MYNQLLLDIQERTDGSYKKLLQDPWFSELLTNYCFKYAKTNEIQDTVTADLWICICDLYKPKKEGDRAQKDEYAKRFLKNRLYYRIKDITIDYAKYNKRHTVYNETLEKITIPQEKQERILGFQVEHILMKAHLPHLEKVTLTLRHCYSWKIEEIAEILNRSPSFIQSLLRNAIHGRHME